ncbi:MAG: hypothetical protein JWR21_66 [Herminiimonas sp.]|nr:hypothetical protein [Herminiimonas sp.]
MYAAVRKNPRDVGIRPIPAIRSYVSFRRLIVTRAGLPIETRDSAAAKLLGHNQRGDFSGS